MMKRFFFGTVATPVASDRLASAAAAFIATSMRGCDVTRAVYNETAGKGPRGDGFGFDFTAEVWLAPGSRQDIDIDAGTAAASAAGLDVERSCTVLAHEHVIKDGSAPIKGTFLSKRRPDSTVAEYLRYWRNEHAAIIQAQADFFAYVRRYVQNHFVAGSYRSMAGVALGQADAFDGAPQMWFDRAEDIYAAFRTEGYLKHIKEDEKILVKVGFSQSYIARERPIRLGDWSV